MIKKWTLLLSALFASSILFADNEVASLESVYKRVSEKASKFVVSITLRRVGVEEQKTVPLLGDLMKELKIETDPFGKRPDAPVTGIIISPDGYIATTYFNMEGDVSDIKVKLPNGKEYDAEMIGYDARKDFALLKIDATGLPTPDKADLSDIKQGELVVALGRGDKSTVWPGIVSATERNYGLYLQIDSKINYGNVGGPILDKNGKLIGMTCGVNNDERKSMWGQNSGVAMALPWDKMDKAIEDIKSGKKKIKPAFLGVSYKDNDKVNGVKVNEVIPNTAASKAGLKAGDIIIEFDGKKVASADEFRQAIFLKSEGDKIKLKVNRDDEELNFDIKLGTWVDTDALEKLLK